jgi:predicted component of type VI protein secretion system
MELGVGFSVGETPIPRPRTPRIVIVATLKGTDAQRGQLNTSQDLNELIASIAPVIDLDIDLSPVGVPEPLTVRLNPRSLGDLKPAAVVAQVPVLAALSELSQRLHESASAPVEPDERVTSALARCRQRPELGALPARWEKAWSDAASGSADQRQAAAEEEDERADRVDRILGLIAGQASWRATTSASGTEGRSPSPVDSGRLGVRGEVDTTLTAILDGILHHADFMAFESTLRGLSFLCSRVRHGLDVTVADQRNDAAGERLRAELESAAAFDLALIDVPIQHNAADLEQLRGIAEAAETARVPTIVGLANDFLDTPKGWPRSLRMLMESPALLGWNALREKACARWVVATFDPFLLRLPHRPIPQAPGYRESARVGNLPWGQAGWLLLERIVAASLAHEWPVGFEGTVAGCVEGLDMVDFDGIQTPLRYPLTAEQVEDLADLGILAPAYEPNRDRVYLLKVPTLIATPPLSNAAQDRSARRMARLDFQLLTAHLVRLITALRLELEVVETDADKAVWLRDRLSSAIAGIRAEVEVESDGVSAEVTVRFKDHGLEYAPVSLQVHL